MYVPQGLYLSAATGQAANVGTVATVSKGGPIQFSLVGNQGAKTVDPIQGVLANTHAMVNAISMRR